MTYATGTFGDVSSFDDIILPRRGSRQQFMLGLAVIGIASAAAVTALTYDWDSDDLPPIVVPVALDEATTPFGSLSDSYTFAGRPSSAILHEAANLPSPPREPRSSSNAIVPEEAPLPPRRGAGGIAENVPLPPARPRDFRLQRNTDSLRSAATGLRGQQTAASAAATAPDNRGFFEKLFGLPAQPAGTALAYARSDEGGLGVPKYNQSVVPAGFDRYTAIYDISAHTVFMPNGEKLEAHSGLGDRLDDPNYVHEKNRGATPPHVYDLEPRKDLFHGVRAIRLNPIGDGHIFGRTGILAHSYMLGPKGDSNGCVSFRDYQRFLQAYDNGEVKRLVVVARRG